MGQVAQTRRYPARLLATGQTTVYVTGDDGTTRKGRAARYTILTTGQYSGTTNITINSKTDARSNNCVVDLETGLMWSRVVSLLVGPASNGLVPWTNTGSGATLEGLWAYIAAANAASYAGYTDWRPPNREEILSLFVHSEVGATLPDSTAFPSFADVWTSTTFKGASTSAVLTQFVNDRTSSGGKTTTLQVAMVRGG